MLRAVGRHDDSDRWNRYDDDRTDVADLQELLPSVASDSDHVDQDIAQPFRAARRDTIARLRWLLITMSSGVARRSAFGAKAAQVRTVQRAALMRSKFMTAWLSMALALSAAACSDKSTPTSPAPTQIDVTGRWATDISIQGLTGRMTWTLTQSSGGVSGPVLVSLTNGFVLLNGFLTGTLTGTSLAYSITVAPGGVPNQPACSGQLGGTMTVTVGAVSTMTGPMSVVSSNCSLQLPSTAITLTRM
jgi:hypothetical protein